MIKVSIIIPVFKVEKYLNKCLQSVVDQTYKNLEIILVDDGSPDKCPSMCDEWAKKDERIKVFHLKNGGVANARNTALRQASGEYIMFADSDDFLELDIVDFLLENIVREKADIAVCGFYGDEYDETVLENITKEKALQQICRGSFVYGVLWNKIYRSEILKDIVMPNLVCSQDLPYNYLAFKKAKKIVSYKDKKYHYRLNNISTTHSKFKAGAFDAIKSREIILNDTKGTDFEKYAVYGLIVSCFVVLSGVIQNGGYENEKKNLIKIIKKYKYKILIDNLYSKKDKFKTLILCLSEKLFIELTKRK